MESFNLNNLISDMESMQSPYLPSFLFVLLLCGVQMEAFHHSPPRRLSSEQESVDPNQRTLPMVGGKIKGGVCDMSGTVYLN